MQLESYLCNNVRAKYITRRENDLILVISIKYLPYTSETPLKPFFTLDKTFESQQTRQKLLKYVSYYKHEQTQESFEIRHLDERFRLNGPLKPISIPRQIKLHIYSLLRTPLVRGR